MNKARTYHPNAGEYPGNVAELHLESNAVAQVALTQGQDGFLIRVWPPNGTHEYGGHNLTAMSAVIRFDDDGKPVVEYIEAGNR